MSIFVSTAKFSITGGRGNYVILHHANVFTVEDNMDSYEKVYGTSKNHKMITEVH